MDAADVPGESPVVPCAASSTMRRTSTARPVTDRSAASTAARCCSHFSRWTGFGRRNVTVSGVLDWNVAGAYTARAMPRRPGRTACSHCSAVSGASLAAGAGSDASLPLRETPRLVSRTRRRLRVPRPSLWRRVRRGRRCGSVPPVGLVRRALLGRCLRQDRRPCRGPCVRWRRRRWHRQSAQELQRRPALRAGAVAPAARRRRGPPNRPSAARPPRRAVLAGRARGACR